MILLQSCITSTSGFLAPPPPPPPQCREAILTLFQTHKSLKKKQLMEELSGRGLTSDIKNVSALLKVSLSSRGGGACRSESYLCLQELCYSKGAQWRLQGT